jgi:putative redox protein
MEIKATITQVEGLQLVGTARKTSIVLDTTPKVHGKDAGMTPKPLTVVSILTELLHRIWKECGNAFKVYTDYTLATEHPKRFVKIHYYFIASEECKESITKHVDRNLSPILKSLKEDIEISYEFTETLPEIEEEKIFSIQTCDGYSIHFLRNNVITGDVDGKWGMTPYEIFLLSLGGCTGMDSISILIKMKQDLKRYRMEILGEVDDNTGVFTKLHVKYIAEGNVDEAKLKKSIDLSRERYCGVQASIRENIPVTYEYEVR